ncbi:MAG: GTPase Era, partial [Rhodospirillales bacterium]
MTGAAGGAAGTRRCGFVAVLGAPNAGKSTLVNRLVGAKVSIVSPRVQTTRNRVSGIAVRGSTQVVFIDTPGIFAAPRRRLERAMVDQAWRALDGADAVIVVVDAARKSIDADTRRILGALKEKVRPAIVALNKIDLVRKDTLLAKAKAVGDTG